MARCTIAAATAESTPPDSAQIARPSPICARIDSTCSSTMLSIVQVCRQPGDVVQEVLEHLLAVLGVQHLGVPLHPGQAAPDVLERRDRRAGRRGQHGEPLGSGRHRVAVRHPDRVLDREVGQQRARRPDRDRRAAVLPHPRVRHLAAEPLRHQLEAVAHPEHRHAGREHASIDARRAVGVDRRRATGQHDRLRLARQHVRHRHGVRHDLGVDPRLPHPPRDQLRVLGPEVDDENQVVVRVARSRHATEPSVGSSVESRPARAVVTRSDRQSRVVRRAAVGCGASRHERRSSRRNARSEPTLRRTCLRSRPGLDVPQARPRATRLGEMHQGPAGEGGWPGPDRPRTLIGQRLDRSPVEGGSVETGSVRPTRGRHTGYVCRTRYFPTKSRAVWTRKYPTR